MSKSSNLRNYSQEFSPPIASDNVKRCETRETPDLLKINCTNHLQNQSVDTSILDPTISRTDYARFSLDRGRGILHSDSHIQLCVKRTNPEAIANPGDVIFPVGSGVLSLLDRAVLRSGTQIIESVSNFSSYYAMKGLLDTNEDVLNRYSVTDGRSNSFQMVTDLKNGSAGQGIIDSGKEEPTQIFLDNNTELSETYTPDAAKEENKVTNHNLKSREVQQLDKGSQFAIPLAHIFQTLRSFSLPLFMIDEVVIVELFFKTAQKDIMFQRKNEVLDPVVITDLYAVDTANVKMICDYISYDASVMQQFAEENETMTLDFNDVVVVKSQNNFDTTPNYSTNIGGSGRYVDMIEVAFEDLPSVDNSGVTPLGNYKSEDPCTSAASTDSLALNFRINDSLVYPLDVSNRAEQFNNLVATQGKPVNLCSTEYSKGAFGNPFSTKFTFERYNIDTAMKGQKKYLGMRNPRMSEPINNAGVSLNVNVTGPVDKSLLVTAYMYIRKSLVFNAGRFAIVER